MADILEKREPTGGPTEDELREQAIAVLFSIREGQKHGPAGRRTRRGLDERERLLVTVIRSEKPLRAFQGRVRRFLMTTPLGGDIRDFMWNEKFEETRTMSSPKAPPGPLRKLPAYDEGPVKLGTLARVMEAMDRVIDNPRLQRRLQAHPFEVRQENRAMARLFLQIWARK